MESQDLDNHNIKITDFGFACFFNPHEGLNDVLGSPLYMAPEIVAEKTYDNRVDIWSVGVIAYILLSGRPPFKARSKEEIFNSIKTQAINFENPCWNKISSEARDFLCLALQKDFKRRASAEELLKSAWLEKFAEKIDIGEQVQLDMKRQLIEFCEASTF